MKHIGGNLYINNDAIEIVDFLVDNKLLPNPVNKAFSVISQLGMDLDLIMYNPDEITNKFLHYKFVDFASNSEALQYLITMFSNLAVENYGFYKPAQRKLEEFLFMLPTYRALFGYKYNEDRETFEKDINHRY